MEDRGSRNLIEVKDLLKSQTERLKNDKPQVEYNKPLTGNILCKLMPYVLPKVESVTHKLGEPDEFKIKRWHD